MGREPSKLRLKSTLPITRPATVKFSQVVEEMGYPSTALRETPASPGVSLLSGYPHAMAWTIIDLPGGTFQVSKDGRVVSAGEPTYDDAIYVVRSQDRDAREVIHVGRDGYPLKERF
jgi:hypothetical protein